MQLVIQECEVSEKFHRKNRCYYITCLLLCISGFVICVSGISYLPQNCPEQNRLGYFVDTPIEQQYKDVRNYQLASNPFKISMSGVGLFAFAALAYFILYKTTENKVELACIKLREKFQKEEEQKQKIQEELLKQAEILKQQQKEQEDLLKQAEILKQQTEETLQKQERLKQIQFQRPQYPGHVYYDHYPPNYRNAIISSRVHPMPLKSILKNSPQV